MWVLGEHRLLCGRRDQMADIEKVLAGGLADMVFTDPPYNVDLRRQDREEAHDRATMLSAASSMSSCATPPPTCSR